jgi:outer membrane immunogenic protein
VLIWFTVFKWCHDNSFTSMSSRRRMVTGSPGARAKVSRMKSLRRKIYTICTIYIICTIIFLNKILREIMIKNFFATAVFLCASSPLMAQSAFQGFYGQLGTGYENNNASGLSSPLTFTDGIQTETLGTVSSPNQNFGGVPLIAGVGYNFSLSPKWLLGIGADYSFLTQETSNYSYGISGINFLDGASLNGAKVKASNRFNIFIMPGYAISEDKLVYLKAGYSSVQVDHTAPNSISYLGESQSLSGSGLTSNQSKTLNGYILGLGYKQIIKGGFYAYAEANYMNYGSQNFGYTRSLGNNVTLKTSTSSSLDSYQLLVGVGYKF